jgi:nicotinate-nucleotide adenylyltransferase
MRIGIFGGTFDPIHMGHLILAEQCRAQANLDEVWFVPSSQPPHKSHSNVTRFDQRCEMLELAIAGHPAFRVDRIEKERAEPSFTAVTLEQLHARHPEHEFFLMMGSDCLPDLPGWYEPRKVIALASLLVVPRPSVMLWTDKRLAKSLDVEAAAVRLQYIACPPIDLASRELRRAIADGMSVRYMIPRAVEEYIRERKLYTAGG